MRSWTVVVPVKLLDAAKTRLAREDRADVALAMAADTVAAAAACSAVTSVLVVTDDSRAAAALAGSAEVVADAPAHGLNPALTHGAEIAARRRPSDGVVALAADLPALTSQHLQNALAAADAVDRALVADSAGNGTVLLTAAPGVPLEPRFGPGSRAAHREAGVVDVTDDLAGTVPGLRRDVDTLADLEDARRIGLGLATLGAVGSAGPSPSVQATVREWDEPSASGMAVADDGTLVPLPAGSRLAGLRRLRPGQRVRVALSAGGPAVIGLVTERIDTERE